MINNSENRDLSSRISLSLRDQIYGYAFIAPQMIGFLLFVLGPLVAVFYFSLQNRNLLFGQATFAGLDNYRAMFEDPLFGKTLQNSLVFTAGLVPLNVLGALGIALLLSGNLRGMILFRAIFFLPVITSAAAWAIVWRFLLQNEGGVNSFLHLVGVDGPNWLRDPNWAMFSVIVTRVLKGVGINMIIFLAAIKNIPQDYQEAAWVDGANRWQSFRSVMLPLLAPAIFLVTILTIIGGLKVFDTIFLMTSGGPSNGTMVLIYYIYYQGFQFFETGYASALSVVLFLVMFTLTLIQWRLRRRFVFDEQE